MTDQARTILIPGHMVEDRPALAADRFGKAVPEAAKALALLGRDAIRDSRRT